MNPARKICASCDHTADVGDLTWRDTDYCHACREVWGLGASEEDGISLWCPYCESPVDPLYDEECECCGAYLEMPDDGLFEGDGLRTRLYRQWQSDRKLNQSQLDRWADDGAPYSSLPSQMGEP